MKKTGRKSKNAKLPSKHDSKDYVLDLYIVGSTARSSRSILNIRTFCDQFLRGRYDLRVVDIYQQPALARSEQIVAAPTLVKRLPLPLRRLVGDFSDQSRVAAGLGLVPIS